MITNYIKRKDKDGIILHTLESIETQYEILTPGLYELQDFGGLMGEVPGFVPLQLADNLIHFKSGIFDDSVELLSRFFLDKTINIYKELGIGHKMGLIFFGKHGTGKTSLCQIIMQTLVERHSAICLDVTKYGIEYVQRTIAKIRKVQQNPICIFIDEIDEAIRLEEYKYLTFLDGTSSITNLAVLGATNNVEKIPSRIKNRKSRIKHMFEIKSLPDEVYKEYLVQKIGKTHSNIVSKFAHFAAESELTIDELKHAITDYIIDGVDIEEAIKTVKIQY